MRLGTKGKRENKLLANRNHADPDNLDLILETIADKLLPFAVSILKSTAESYALLDPKCDSARDVWIHMTCDLTCQSGMLESGESVPAEIQVKAEEFNDLLRELQRRIKRVRTMLSRAVLSDSSEASRKLAQLVHQIIVDYAGEMVLAGQHKDADAVGQYPNVPVMKDETNPFPVPATPMQWSTDDAAVPKAKTKNSEITEETSRDEVENPRPNRRNERTNSRKAKTIRNGLQTAGERREAVQAYIDEVFEKTGKRITRTDIWKYVHYKNRTEFQRWQRNDPKATRTANERFTRILKDKPHLK